MDVDGEGVDFGNNESVNWLREQCVHMYLPMLYQAELRGPKQ